MTLMDQAKALELEAVAHRVDRMAAEGIGQARRTSGEDILARFQAEIAPAATSAPQA